MVVIITVIVSHWTWKSECFDHVVCCFQSWKLPSLLVAMENLQDEYFVIFTWKGEGNFNLKPEAWGGKMQTWGLFGKKNTTTCHMPSHTGFKPNIYVTATLGRSREDTAPSAQVCAEAAVELGLCTQEGWGRKFPGKLASLWILISQFSPHTLGLPKLQEVLSHSMLQRSSQLKAKNYPPEKEESVWAFLIFGRVIACRGEFLMDGTVWKGRY